MFVNILFMVLVLTANLAVAAGDPMQPPAQFTPTVATETVFQSLSLTAIVWSQERQVAVINGKVVKVGDEVGGAVVRDIARRAVTVQRGLKRWSMPLLAGPGGARNAGVARAAEGDSDG